MSRLKLGLMALCILLTGVFGVEEVSASSEVIDEVLQESNKEVEIPWEEFNEYSKEELGIVVEALHRKGKLTEEESGTLTAIEEYQDMVGMRGSYIFGGLMISLMVGFYMYMMRLQGEDSWLDRVMTMILLTVGIGTLLYGVFMPSILPLIH